MSSTSATLPPPSEQGDPDVLGLVPPPRRGRALLVAVAVLAALVLAWASVSAKPRLLHPSHSEGAARDLGGGRALVGVRIERQGFLPLTVDSVDVPGVDVEAAWVVDTRPADFAPSGYFFDGGAPVSAANPPPRARPLPAAATDGDYLVVLYRGVDCHHLTFSDVTVLEHTLLGIETDESLSGIGGPDQVCH